MLVSIVVLVYNSARSVGEIARRVAEIFAELEDDLVGGVDQRRLGARRIRRQVGALADHVGPEPFGAAGDVVVGGDHDPVDRQRGARLLDGVGEQRFAAQGCQVLAGDALRAAAGGEQGEDAPGVRHGDSLGHHRAVGCSAVFRSSKKILSRVKTRITTRLPGWAAPGWWSVVGSAPDPGRLGWATRVTFVAPSRRACPSRASNRSLASKARHLRDGLALRVPCRKPGQNSRDAVLGRQSGSHCASPCRACDLDRSPGFATVVGGALRWPSGSMIKHQGWSWAPPRVHAFEAICCELDRAHSRGKRKP